MSPDPKDVIRDGLAALRSEATAAGATELEAVRRIEDQAAADEAEIVASERERGTTWADIARQLGRSKQAVQQRYSGAETPPAPGLSAAEAAREAGVHRSSITRNPGRHGFEVIPGVEGQPRYRRAGEGRSGS